MNFLEALHSFNKTNYREAIEGFKKVIAREPRNSEAYNYIAICYRELGYYLEAIKFTNQALEINPELAEAYFNKAATCLLKLYDKSTAPPRDNIEYKESLGKALRCSNSFELDYFYMGLVNYICMDFYKAHDYFRLAYKQSPLNAIIQSYLARTSLELRYYREASSLLDKVLEANPGNFWAQNNKSVLCIKAFKYWEAFYLAAKAIESEPAFPVAYYNMALVQLRFRDYSSAISTLTKANEIFSHYNSYELTNARASVLDKKALALEALARQVNSKYKTHSDNLVLIAKSYLSEARKANFKFYKQVGEIALQAEKYEVAIKNCNLAIYYYNRNTLDVKNTLKENLIEIQNTLANSFYNLGTKCDYESAIKCLERIEELSGCSLEQDIYEFKAKIMSNLHLLQAEATGDATKAESSSLETYANNISNENSSGDSGRNLVGNDGAEYITDIDDIA